MSANNRPVRVGIYGTGRFANQTHLPNLSKLDDVELVAASDPNPDNLAATAQKYSIARTYADPHQMLAEEQLERALFGRAGLCALLMWKQWP